MDAVATLDRICEAMGGSYADLAKLLGVSDAAISQWKKGGIPPGRALEIEQKLDGKVRAAEMHVTIAKKRKPRRAA